MRILRSPERLWGHRACLPGFLIFLAFFFAVQAIAIEIPLQKQGGVYSLPVRINGVITLNFILDSGASEVTVPADVALTLLRAGTISEKDFLPGKKYRLADGSLMKGARFKIRQLEVAGFRISDVPAVVVSIDGSLLLGQSFLSRASHWAIDNEKQVLVLSDSKANIGASGPARTESEKADKLYGLAVEENRALQWDSCLAMKAFERAKQLETQNYFAHEDPKTGPNPVWKTVSQCIPGKGKKSKVLAGENLTKGDDTAANIHMALMKSPEHRKNILDRRFNRLGVGCYDTICVELFVGY